MPTEKSKVRFQYGPQTDYDNLEAKEDNVFYITSDTKRVYLGNDLYTKEYDPASSSASGLMSSEDKIKLDGLNLVILTEDEYNNLTPENKTAFIYFIKKEIQQQNQDEALMEGSLI